MTDMIAKCTPGIQKLLVQFPAALDHIEPTDDVDVFQNRAIRAIEPLLREAIAFENFVMMPVTETVH